jgi:hypothetical protein
MEILLFKGGANMKKVTEVSLKRLEDLQILDSRRLDEKMAMNDIFSEKMLAAEAARLDAIRAVDMNAITIANEKTVAQAAVLATQLTETTNSLRAFISEGLQKQTEMIESANKLTYDKIDSLEKSQSAYKGKASITTPLLMLVSSLMGGLVVFIIEAIMR